MKSLRVVAVVLALVAVGSACVPPPSGSSLTVSTAALPRGVVGLPYLGVLEVAGASGGVTWSSSGLPDGLTLSTDGVINGSPEQVGDFGVVLSARDGGGRAASKTLTISVPTSVPPECRSARCSTLVPDPNTVAIASDRVLDVARDVEGRVVSVRISGSAPQIGAVAAFDAGGLLPSGYVAAVTGVTVQGDQSVVLELQPVDLGAAFNDIAFSTGPSGGPAALRVEPAAASLSASSFRCTGSVKLEAGSTTVAPSFAPSVTALSKRPFFGAGGIYLGAGGLDLFHFGLEGSLDASLDFGVSGATSCTASLPEVVAVAPVGGPLAVVLRLKPTLTVEVSGAARVRTGARLHCFANYFWYSSGSSDFTKLCRSSVDPLGLDSANGVDATITGAIDASVTISEVAGVTGNVTGQVHAGWGPTRTPKGQIDARVSAELGACLACFWKDSPTRVTVVEGTLFEKVLATYGSAPTTLGPPPAPPSLRLIDWNASVISDWASGTTSMTVEYVLEGDGVIATYQQQQTGAPFSMFGWRCFDREFPTVPTWGGGSVFPFEENKVSEANGRRTYRQVLTVENTRVPDSECRAYLIELADLNGVQMSLPDEAAIDAAGFGKTFLVDAVD